jgi:hypothetical protein
MWLMTGSTRRDERGAVAIIFAISAVMIFGLAAMGVDLGNAMNRKKQNQTSADFAALAGADGLPDTNAAIQKVAAYLNKNQPTTDGNDKCDQSSGPVTIAELTDTILSNGEVTFPNGKIQVLAPATKVSFGMANAIGINDTCVQSAATAAIKSGGTGMAPYYATSSCDSGIQTLKSNAAGLSVPASVPQLYADSETNGSSLSSISPTQIPLATAPGDPPSTITLTGNKLDAANIDQVGFFNSDRSAPKIGTIVASPPQGAGIVALNVPYEVASVQDIWYVRVHSTATAATNPNKWSARSDAIPLIVGNAVLSCNPDSVTGNFGSLDLPGWKGTAGVNSVNEQLSMNIAAGLKPPLSLTTYKGTPFPAGICPAEGPGSATVISEDKDHLSPDTNCVSTSPGLDTGAATDGFLTGVGSGPGSATGKLDADTSQACQDLGRPTRYAGNIAGKNLNVNDDLLTCFFKDPNTTIAQAIAYNGNDSLFTQDIWNSPRFSLVPVFTSDPNGNKIFPIQKFVAGFIADQPTGASRQYNQEVNLQTDHGLVVTWSGSKPKLGAIRMIFFPLDALPPPPDGGSLSEYFGDGKKIITLVN